MQFMNNMGIHKSGKIFYASKKALLPARLIRRYKRFLADVRFEDGSEATAHCTNSGSMKSCLEEGAEVFVSPADDPKRKTRFTWEMIRIGGHWVGINTSRPNELAEEWLNAGVVPCFQMR